MPRLSWSRGGKVGLWGIRSPHYHSIIGHPTFVESIGVLGGICGHFKKNLTAFSNTFHLFCRKKGKKGEALGDVLSISAFPMCALPPCFCDSPQGNEQKKRCRCLHELMEVVLLGHPELNEETQWFSMLTPTAEEPHFAVQEAGDDTQQFVLVTPSRAAGPVPALPSPL